MRDLKDTFTISDYVCDSVRLFFRYCVNHRFESGAFATSFYQSVPKIAMYDKNTVRFHR